MRISPDTAPHFEPEEAGDLCAPAGRSSIVTGRGRAWQHGRWWVNDPDCLLTGRNVEQREVLAAHVERYGGLLGVSDRMADLDDWGRSTLERLCRQRPGPRRSPSYPASLPTSSRPVSVPAHRHRVADRPDEPARRIRVVEGHQRPPAVALPHQPAAVEAVIGERVGARHVERSGDRVGRDRPDAAGLRRTPDRGPANLSGRQEKIRTGPAVDHLDLGHLEPVEARHRGR